MNTRALALPLLLVASGCSAKAEDPAQPEESHAIKIAALPRPEGPLLDQADILPPSGEAALETRLRAYWDKTRTALVVVTVDSLGGEPIERYANALARAWDIGDTRTYRGILVLIAPNERQVRIETSCGVQDAVTDEFAGRVIEDVMIPKFRADDLGGGVLAAVDALIARLDAVPVPANLPDTCPTELKKAA